MTQYLRYQYGVTCVNPSVIVHLCDFDKRHLILAKLYINDVSHIRDQTVKFQINLPKQTIIKHLL